MDKWKKDFLNQIKAGKDPHQAATSSAGLPLEAVSQMRDDDTEFAMAWDLINSGLPAMTGEMVPTLDELVDLPATNDLKELCRAVTEHTTRRLIQIALTSDSETNALKAISEIHDRAYGKSAQSVQHSGEIDIGLAGMLAQARARVNKGDNE